MTATTDQKTPEELAAEQQAEAATQAADANKGGEGGEQQPEGADALGDKGKQALDRMKADVKAAKAELAQYKSLGLDPDKLKELISTSETAAATAEQERTRREAETAALSKANDRLVKAEIKAAATGKLANPALAAQLLAATGVDVSSFDVDDDGNVDSAAITAAIDALITNEPYLAVQSDQKRFQGGADGGPRGTAGKPQWTRQDIERASREGRNADIEAARQAGLLNDALGIKPST